jgi:hypothetical protein
VRASGVPFQTRDDSHASFVDDAEPRMIVAFAGVYMAKKQKRRTIRAWSNEDVRSLKAFAKARMSGPQIAKKLKRTAGAVSQKAFALGVRFRSIRPKRK